MTNIYTYIEEVTFDSLRRLTSLATRYSISHKKVKVPYRTRTAPVPHSYSTLSELRAYFERTTNRAAHAQFGSVRYASIQCGAVRYGAVRWL